MRWSWRCDAPEEVPSQRVRVRFIPVGEASLELLEATDSQSVDRAGISSGAGRVCTT